MFQGKKSKVGVCDSVQIIIVDDVEKILKWIKAPLFFSGFLYANLCCVEKRSNFLFIYFWRVSLF